MTAPGSPLSGVYAAIPTPFDERGRIDSKALDHIVDYLLSRDLQGIALLTEAGEDAVLLPDERRALTTAVGGRIQGRKGLLVAVSSASTHEAVDLARLAESKSATGILLCPPRTPGVGYRELYRHVDRVVRATPLPVLFQGRRQTALDSLAPEEVETLAKHAGLKGAYLPEGGSQEIESWAKRFKGREHGVFSGCSLWFSGSAASGASGSICGIALLSPDVAAKVYSAVRKKEATLASELEHRVEPALELLLPPGMREDADRVRKLASRLAKRPLEGFMLHPAVPFGLVKEALKLQGHPVKSFVRPPFENITQESSDRLRAALKRAEMLG